MLLFFFRSSTFKIKGPNDNANTATTTKPSEISLSKENDVHIILPSKSEKQLYKQYCVKATFYLKFFHAKEMYIVLQ